MTKNTKWQKLDQVEQEEERGRRHAAFEESESFSEDGVPVRNKKYAAYKRDGQGRVEIPQHNFTNIDFYKKNSNSNESNCTGSTLEQGSGCTTPGSSIGLKIEKQISKSFFLSPLWQHFWIWFWEIFWNNCRYYVKAREQDQEWPASCCETPHGCPDQGAPQVVRVDLIIYVCMP